MFGGKPKPPEVELLMLNPEVAVPAQIYDEIQEEVLRLSSLRQEVTDPDLQSEIRR